MRPKPLLAADLGYQGAWHLGVPSDRIRGRAGMGVSQTYAVSFVPVTGLSGMSPGAIAVVGDTSGGVESCEFRGQLGAG